MKTRGLAMTADGSRSDELEDAITAALEQIRNGLVTSRALKLHTLALSVVKRNGRPALGDCSSMTECKVDGLTIRYWPKQHWLEILYSGKVLTVEPCAGALKVIHYTPGHWELDLIRAAKVAA